MFILKFCLDLIVVSLAFVSVSSPGFTNLSELKNWFLIINYKSTNQGIMTKMLLPFFAAIILISCSDSKVESNKTTANNTQTTVSSGRVENLLTAPELVKFKGTDYKLAWSSHPSENYYKQEYIPSGEIIDEYRRMIGIELLGGVLTAQDAVDQKIAEIKARKATDRLSNFELREDKEKNELILDFMLSEGTGESVILEWNVYRYANYQNAGEKGLTLFSYSQRAFGNEVIQFGPDIRDNRKKYVEEFTALKRPEIKMK